MYSSITRNLQQSPIFAARSSFILVLGRVIFVFYHVMLVLPFVALCFTRVVPCCFVLLLVLPRVVSCCTRVVSCCVVLSRVAILVVCEKIAGITTVTLLKRRLRHRCYHVTFVKVLKTPFFVELFRWLLLQEKDQFYSMQPITLGE